jgi:hypothetical protein
MMIPIYADEKISRPPVIPAIGALRNISAIELERCEDNLVDFKEE